jgi:hypothetical protein
MILKHNLRMASALQELKISNNCFLPNRDIFRDYMFWANQKPYFKEDVLPCFSKDQ